MKKVVSHLLMFSFLTLVIACNGNSEKQSDALVNDTSTDDLAKLDSVLDEQNPEYLYVTAYSGLSLREFNNLNSEKLAVMPRGTKLKIISFEKKLTMNVGGIKGGMNEVEYNQKKGFAFNGYLSKFFPPDEDSSAKGYVDELQAVFPQVSYSEKTGGTASRPSNSEIILLPTSRWHEAFFVAQQLYKIPREFEFPNPKGDDSQLLTIKNTKDTAVISELHISRLGDELQKIEYLYKNKKFENKVIITKKGEMMEIEKIETVE